MHPTVVEDKRKPVEISFDEDTCGVSIRTDGVCLGGEAWGAKVVNVTIPGAADFTLCSHILGNDGEDLLSIHLMAIQNKTTEILVVYSAIDASIVTCKKMVVGYRTKDVEDGINAAIAGALGFKKEVLPA